MKLNKFSKFSKFNSRDETTWHTGDLRVAGESYWAVADRLVPVDVALGVGAAAAGVNAVPVVAGGRQGTVVVGLTADKWGLGWGKIS